jgi:hypothetical protein
MAGVGGAAWKPTVWRKPGLSELDLLAGQQQLDSCHKLPALVPDYAVS